METMVFSPLLLTGATSQKQRLEIVYTAEFYNDPVNMAARMELEIQSQFIQVGSQNDSLIKLSSDILFSPPDSRRAEWSEVCDAPSPLALQSEWNPR